MLVTLDEITFNRPTFVFDIVLNNVVGIPEVHAIPHPAQRISLASDTDELIPPEKFLGEMKHYAVLLKCQAANELILVLMLFFKVVQQHRETPWVNSMINGVQ